MTADCAQALKKKGFEHLSDLVAAMHKSPGKLGTALQAVLSSSAAEDCQQVLARMPYMQMHCSRPELQTVPEAFSDTGDDSAAEQYSVQVTLARQGEASPGSRSQKAQTSQRPRVFAPRYGLCCSVKLPQCYHPAEPAPRSKTTLCCDLKVPKGQGGGLVSRHGKLCDRGAVGSQARHSGCQRQVTGINAVPCS